MDFLHRWQNGRRNKKISTTSLRRNTYVFLDNPLSLTLLLLCCMIARIWNKNAEKSFFGLRESMLDSKNSKSCRPARRDHFESICVDACSIILQYSKEVTFIVRHRWSSIMPVSSCRFLLLFFFAFFVCSLYWLIDLLYRNIGALKKWNETACLFVTLRAVPAVFLVWYRGFSICSYCCVDLMFPSWYVLLWSRTWWIVSIESIYSFSRFVLSRIMIIIGSNPWRHRQRRGCRYRW